MVASVAFLLFAADSLGRRKSLLVSSVGQAATLFVIGVYDKLYPSRSDSVSIANEAFRGDAVYQSQVRVSDTQGHEQIPPLGYVAIVCVYLYVL